MIQLETDDTPDGVYNRRITFRSSCQRKPILCCVVLVVSFLLAYDIGLRFVFHVRTMV